MRRQFGILEHSVEEIEVGIGDPSIGVEITRQFALDVPEHDPERIRGRLDTRFVSQAQIDRPEGLHRIEAVRRGIDQPCKVNVEMVISEVDAVDPTRAIRDLSLIHI